MKRWSVGNRFLRVSTKSILIVLAVAGITLADAATQRFGARTLTIPDPDGFAALANDVPQYIQVAQAYLPATNRLIDAYASPADKQSIAAGRGAELKRYFQLQVPRRADGTPVSEADFQSASKEVESGLEAALKNSDQLASDLMKKGNSEVKKLTSTDPGVSISGVGYLGVFRREPWGIFFSIRSKVGATGSSTDKLVCSGALVLINFQLVYLYSYAMDRGESDRRWAEDSLSAWADAIRAANPNDPAVASTTGGGSNRLIKNILLGAIIGGLVFLVSKIIRKN
jgi:hypothetical protein